MKTLPTLAATVLALALLMTPMIATAASSITFTSPAAGASYSGSTSYSISGAVSPAPTQADNVGIVVKNPSGTTVDVGNVPVTSGAFTYATAVGGSSSWVTGTYTITAVDSFGTTGTTSFAYSAPSSNVYNVTRALVNIQRNQTIILGQLATLQKDMKGNATQEQNSLTSISTSLTSISSAIATLTTNLNTLSGSVTTLNNAVTGISSQVTSIANQVGSINTAVQGLGTQVSNAATQAKAAADAVSSTQTYVLVVAVLAAITLVLELAILVRKLS